jgi:DDE superfamily endonuclease
MTAANTSSLALNGHPTSSGVPTLSSSPSLSVSQRMARAFNQGLSFRVKTMSVRSGLTKRFQIVLGACINSGESTVLLTLLHRISTSETGWTDNHLGFEWFQKVFIPQASARRDDPNDKILLILDGHGSHEAVKMIDLSEQHNIQILLLPPHTTHKLQPLDVGVFGPLQKAWITQCDKAVEETGEEIPLKDFVKVYLEVRNIAFQPETIRTAWRKSGCYPPTINVFTPEDFAPSIPFSTSTPSLPPSFPTFEVTPVTGLDWDCNSEPGEEYHSDDESDDDSSLDQPCSRPPPLNLPPSYVNHPPPSMSSSTIDTSSAPQPSAPLSPPPPPPLPLLPPLPLPPPSPLPRPSPPSLPSTRQKQKRSLEERVEGLERENKRLRGDIDIL